MKIFQPLAFCPILVVYLCAAQSEHSADWSCDPGWVAFKDDKCFKILDNTTRTYAEAVSTCSSLSNGAILPTIHSTEEQEFLSNYLFNTSKMVDNFWIGAQFVNNTFGWVDKSHFSYTNWDSRGPRRRANYCVQMQFDGGKWYDEPCERKNAFVCQKMQTWSMARLQQTLLDARKELRDALVETNRKNDDAIKLISQHKQELVQANNRISEQKHELDEANKKINIFDKSQIPIGFIYTQLPDQLPPTSIWPSMTWSDISSTYAGVFFRVYGGDSNLFGETQSDNAPRLIKIEKTTSHNYYDHLIFDASSVGRSSTTSNWFHSGDWGAPNNIFYRYTVSGGEVRPINMAIQVWKRTG